MLSRKRVLLVVLALLAVVGLASCGTSGGSDAKTSDDTESSKDKDSGKDSSTDEASSDDNSVDVNDSGGGSGMPDVEDATDDVAFDGCVTKGEFDDLTFKVDITNSSDETSDFNVEVAFESKDGSEQYSTSSVYAQYLHAGQTTKATGYVDSSDTLPSDLATVTCKVSSAERTKAGAYFGSDEEDDVTADSTLESCAADDYGSIEAKVKAKNSSDAKASIVAVVTVNSKDGKTQLGIINPYAENVEPGQSATASSSTYLEGETTADIKCTLENVTLQPA